MFTPALGDVHESGESVAGLNDNSPAVPSVFSSASLSCNSSTNDTWLPLSFELVLPGKAAINV